MRHVTTTNFCTNHTVNLMLVVLFPTTGVSYCFPSHKAQPPSLSLIRRLSSRFLSAGPFAHLGKCPNSYSVVVEYKKGLSNARQDYPLLFEKPSIRERQCQMRVGIYLRSQSQDYELYDTQSTPTGELNHYTGRTYKHERYASHKCHEVHFMQTTCPSASKTIPTPVPNNSIHTSSIHTSSPSHQPHDAPGINAKTPSSAVPSKGPSYPTPSAVHPGTSAQTVVPSPSLMKLPPTSTSPASFT